MKIFRVIVLGAICWSPLICYAQHRLPDAPSPAPPHGTAVRQYTPATPGERFSAYAKATFSFRTILEAGVRGGLQQARGVPSGWPGGAEGFGDRFGSAVGEIVVRNTTKLVVADLFREDIRFIPCNPGCSKSLVVAALEDTFLARKGDDGHRSFSVAQVVGPVVGSATAVYGWYPPGSSKSEIGVQTGVVLSVQLVKNFIRERKSR
jgi:hypothetical protein